MWLLAPSQCNSRVSTIRLIGPMSGGDQVQLTLARLRVRTSPWRSSKRKEQEMSISSGMMHCVPRHLSCPMSTLLWFLFPTISPVSVQTLCSLFFPAYPIPVQPSWGTYSPAFILSHINPPVVSILQYQSCPRSTLLQFLLPGIYSIHLA